MLKIRTSHAVFFTLSFFKKLTILKKDVMVIIVQFNLFSQSLNLSLSMRSLLGAEKAQFDSLCPVGLLLVEYSQALVLLVCAPKLHSSYLKMLQLSS